MTDETPRDVAVGFLQRVSANDFEGAWARLAPDVVYDVIAPPPIGGRFDRDGLGASVAQHIMPALAEPLRLSIDGVTAEGERVAVEVTSVAAAKSGRTYNNRYHFLFVVRGGKIVEAREYLDSSHLYDIVG